MYYVFKPQELHVNSCVILSLSGLIFLVLSPKFLCCVVTVSVLSFLVLQQPQSFFHIILPFGLFKYLFSYSIFQSCFCLLISQCCSTMLNSFAWTLAPHSTHSFDDREWSAASQTMDVDAQRRRQHHIWTTSETNVRNIWSWD